MDGHFQLTEFVDDEIEDVGSKAVVYLRKVNKKCKKVSLPSLIALPQIFHIVSQYVQLSAHDFSLYFLGQKYDYSKPIDLVSTHFLTLSNPSIFHIHAHPPTQTQMLQIYLTAYTDGYDRLINQSFTLPSTRTIKHFISDVRDSFIELQSMSLGLVESGRRLDEEKTFCQEDVENQSVIVLISEEGISQLTKKTNNKIQTRMEIRQLEANKVSNSMSMSQQPLTSPKKTYSSHSEDFQTVERVPNFKKKQKGIVLYKKSPHKTENQFIWESDSNSSQANKNEFFKALQIKKQKENTQAEIQGSFLKKSDRRDGEKFSLRDRFQIKHQMRKLFQSQSLYHGETEVKKLEPPQISTDQFIQEIEEIDFMDSGEDNKPEQKIFNTREIPDRKFQSMNLLHQSIGKSKRANILEQLIPTRDKSPFISQPASLSKEESSDSDSEEEENYDEMVMEL